MAKARTVWKWRDKEFGTRRELIAHLKQRAEEAIKGQPVDEVRGRDRQIHSVRVKVQVLLGPWPSRQRQAARTTAVAEPKSRKRVPPLKPLDLTDADAEGAKYYS